MSPKSGLWKAEPGSGGFGRTCPTALVDLTTVFQRVGPQHIMNFGTVRRLGPGYGANTPRGTWKAEDGEKHTEV